MRFRKPLTLAALLLLTSGAARAQEGEQKKDEQVIEEFITTRGVTFVEPGKGAKKQTTPSAAQRRKGAQGKGPGAVASGKSPGKGGAASKSDKGGGAHPAAGAQAQATGGEGGGAEVLKAAAGARPLALGYTILLKDDAGRLTVVDPQREFRTGDRFAVALETNEDGYLYMFSATNGRNPELLFPNAQIDGGENSVQAHARATFPTGADAEAEYFIDVTDPPADEHLFIIFSRRPLADVPRGEALVKYCGKEPEDCAWKPSPAQWARILGGAKGRRVTEARSPQLAQAGPPPVQPGMLQRSLKVKREDPKPAVVRVNDTPDAEVLVTEIVLTHK